MAFQTYAQFKIQSTSTAQPVVGSWVTAGFPGVPTKGSVTLTLGTALASGNDASVIFAGGGLAWLVDPGDTTGTSGEEVSIQSVSGNTVTLFPKRNGEVLKYNHVNGAFGTGTFIIPIIEMNSFYIQSVPGNAGFIYFGSNLGLLTPSGSPSFRHGIARINKVASTIQPVDFSSAFSFFGNQISSQELWIIADNANDQYQATFSVL